MDVGILLALELLTTHVTGSVHVQLHMGVKLRRKKVYYYFIGNVSERTEGVLMLNRGCKATVVV